MFVTVLTLLSTVYVAKISTEMNTLKNTNIYRNVFPVQFLGQTNERDSYLDMGLVIASESWMREELIIRCQIEAGSFSPLNILCLATICIPVVG